MTAVLTPILGSSQGGQLLDPDRASRTAAHPAFAAILASTLPPEPTHAHPPVPPAIDAELKPRAKLGIAWPTLPARFSPPKRGSATTSSAPAGPDDGPSGQPLTTDNAPALEGFGEPETILGPRLGTARLQPIELPAPDQAFRTPATANGPEFLEAMPTPGPRRRPGEPLLRGMDSLMADGASPSETEVRETDPGMFADPFQADADGAETDGLETWEDVLLSRTEERAVRVEFDADLSVEVRALQGDVDVYVDGTAEALEELRDLEYDLEQALADGGEHHLASYSETRRDPTARPQASGNHADPEGAPAREQRRYAPGGRLFNGIA